MHSAPLHGSQVAEPLKKSAVHNAQQLFWS